MKKRIIKPEPKGWQKIQQAWQKMTSPSRPSLGDMKIYNDFMAAVLNKCAHGRVLILGATPELRNLVMKRALSRRIDLYLLDLNQDMIRAMDQFIEIKNVVQKKIIGGWLSMPFKNEYFDVVLGDEVLINVDQEDREKLLLEISRVLKKRGAFITRASHVNPQARTFTVRKSFDKYTNLYLQNKLTFNQVLNYLFEEMFELSYFKNKKKFLLIKTLLPECLKEARSSKPLKKFIINSFIREYKALFNQCWSWELKSAQIKRFKKYFLIKKIKSANDYWYAHILPIYLLIKN
ncbi:MAG: class I SAM-dependent methyltransferase [Patescibacteria group bacterium]|nr:class I SAM-dependent methyltransferase [Patescibacteria group bacterium]MDD5121025.1 class I SAM-dependent methyltransferase [Patescibacteria group bacterium]MDD5221614.1 class I SAM-dependent methyltransferase [Patescibacteria group bacterium]MDD5396056.1 class I SAM-dependent methyltransferase [Patescibacteria group bacterium]